MEAATNRGIIVMNTPGTNAMAAGEQAICTDAGTQPEISELRTIA